jgi:hypothetical protein
MTVSPANPEPSPSRLKWSKNGSVAVGCAIGCAPVDAGEADEAGEVGEADDAGEVVVVFWCFDVDTDVRTTLGHHKVSVSGLQQTIPRPPTKGPSALRPEGHTSIVF